MTDERALESELATAIAKELLKPGDRLYIARCGGIRSTVTFRTWEGRWIITPTLSDVHASHILRINRVKRNLWHEAQAILRNLPEQVRASAVNGMRLHREHLQQLREEHQAALRQQVAEEISDDEVPW